MNFEWNESKRRVNIDKHGLDFVDAWRIFELPVLDKVDDRDEYGETRYFGIGLLDELTVGVVFTMPHEDTVRIISLRRALKHEKRQYENHLRNQLGLRKLLDG